MLNRFLSSFNIVDKIWLKYAIILIVAKPIIHRLGVSIFGFSSQNLSWLTTALALGLMGVALTELKEKQANQEN